MFKGIVFSLFVSLCVVSLVQAGCESSTLNVSGNSTAVQGNGNSVGGRRATARSARTYAAPTAYPDLFKIEFEVIDPIDFYKKLAAFSQCLYVFNGVRLKKLRMEFFAVVDAQVKACNVIAADKTVDESLYSRNQYNLFLQAALEKLNRYRLADAGEVFELIEEIKKQVSDSLRFLTSLILARKS